jgi:hypothetical protein
VLDAGWVERRATDIPVLRHRMDEAGVTKLTRLDDLVPLLFSHTTYKSYPESFVRDGRWRHLTLWMAALSTLSIEVDLEGCTDVDDWLRRMHAADNWVIASSGTSGKCSFLSASLISVVSSTLAPLRSEPSRKESE